MSSRLPPEAWEGFPGKVFLSPGAFLGLKVRDLEEVISPWLAYGVCKNILPVVFETGARYADSIVTSSVLEFLLLSETQLLLLFFKFTFLGIVCTSLAIS